MTTFSSKKKQALRLAFCALGTAAAMFAVTGCDDTVPSDEFTFTPVSGTIDGKTVVTIEGEGLAQGDSVKMDGKNCDEIKFVSDTKIQCTTAKHAAGAVSVSVIKGADEIELETQYHYGVEIDSVTPDLGTGFGGTTISVRGNYFEQGDQVLVGGVHCSSTTFVSAQELTCVTPAHADGDVDVSVTRLADVLEGTLKDGYTYGCQDNTSTSLVVWANDGGDKVPQEDRRAICDPSNVKNSVWDGSGTVKIFGAKNEVVAFNLVLEAPDAGTNGVKVEFNTLTGPGGAKIQSSAAAGDGVYNWTGRNIELFYVRYLPIKGLSKQAYGTDDERQVPKGLQRPWTGEGIAAGGTGWTDRPNHDKNYPDIAVPIEAQGLFNIPASKNQSVWVDIYIPKNAAKGTYTGSVTITHSGSQTVTVPVSLEVRGFELADEPNSKTMIYLSWETLALRYFNTEDMIQAHLSDNTIGPRMDLIRNRFFQMAHRHKLSLIDTNAHYEVGFPDSPRDAWIPRLNGNLFTAASGYDGPGVGKGNGVYSVGTYDTWMWNSWIDSSTNPGGYNPANDNQYRQDMWDHTNAWEQWFKTNLPGVERFLFLADEPTPEKYNWIGKNTAWMKSNAGVGKDLASFVATKLTALPDMPTDLGIDIVASTIAVGDPAVWDAAVSSHHVNNPKAKFWAYNGKRPGSGSFAIEDDGTALRELPWGQYKKGIGRWFLWESTYYKDTQNGFDAGDTDLFHNAKTFGGPTGFDPILGMTATSGVESGNGNGVLFYPGTEMVHPADSYALNGPIASLRMKHWRRGIQDVDYIAKAMAVNASKTQAIINQMVPKVLWETGLTSPGNNSSSRVAPSWSSDPDVWEKARKDLADIIEGI